MKMKHFITMSLIVSGVLVFIQSKSAEGFEPGRIAPEFKTHTLTGEEIKLDDFEGKLVLLDFWASWCKPCQKEAENLKKLYDTYRQDDRFVILGLSVDKDISAAKEFVERKNLKWHQGYIGIESQLPKKYRIAGIPTLFLIGPDGKILARDLRGHEVHRIVEKTLSQLGADDSGLIAEGAKVTQLADEFKFTEGPAADSSGNVYFTDIPNSKIHIWTTRDDLETFMENTQKANGLFFDRHGNLIACQGGARQLVSISPDKQVTVLTDNYKRKKYNSLNDLWIAPDGGIYFTDPRYGNRDGMELDGEHVYYLSPDRKKVKRVIDDMVRPNGLIGTPDGKLVYVADHGGKKTYVYHVQQDGTLTGKKLFAPQGSDGMTIDQQGNVYLTSRDVTVYNPQGQKITTIDIPEIPSNVCFGGKNRDILFVTARKSLYSIKMKVKGVY